jgi:competence protein ComEC
MTLLYLAAAWVAGIALASACHPPWQVLPVLGLASVLGLLLQSDDRTVRLGSLSLLLFVLGAGRLLLAAPHFNESSLATYNNAGWVVLEGVVVGDPDEREDHTNLRVRAERLTLPDGTEREVKGLVLVQAGRYPQRAYGDRLRVAGLLTSPPVFGEFSYREYLARQGIHSYVRRAHVTELAQGQAKPLLTYLFDVKRRSQDVIADMLPEPEAALLSGILLGVDTGIPEEVMEDFRATGTSHVIVISGFNVTIVAGIFAGLAGRLLHRRLAILTAIVGVAVYTVLVGASAPVLRAAMMGGLYLFARYVGRKSFAPVSLAATALVMTAWNPYALWDQGFRLSFAATAGLMFYTEPLERLSEGALKRIASAERTQQIVGLVSEVLLVTIAAGLTTGPILLGSFGKLSPITLLSNMLILPAQSYCMLLGGLATVLGLVLRPLGRAVGWLAWLLLSYTIETVRWTSRIPLPSVSGSIARWMVWAYYAVLGTGTWWFMKPIKKHHQIRERVTDWLSTRVRTKLLVTASGLLAALAFFAWRALPDGHLHVHVLDVGQGDAILIRTPAGRQVLIDGGQSPNVLLSCLGRQMPFWDRSIDLVVLTHQDDDHITGLVEVLERYEVGDVVFRDMGCEDPVCERWRELLADGEVNVHRGEAGLKMMIDEGVHLDVLHPGAGLLRRENFNENSVVTQLSYGSVSMLFTGDIEARAEENLLKNGECLQSTVLKVAHHGGRSSSTPAFLEAVDPQVAVISVGNGNDFGHPHDEVLRRLESVVSKGTGEPLIYRTDRDGTVEVVSDGADVWVETERGR